MGRYKEPCRDRHLAFADQDISRRQRDGTPDAAKDWSRTSLGSPEEWPEALKVAVGIGVLTDYFQQLTPKLDRAEAKRQTQVVIRWLLHFAPGTYQMVASGYSEILARVDPEASTQRDTIDPR